jgi:hypothetical protein
MAPRAPAPRTAPIAIPAFAPVLNPLLPVCCVVFDVDEFVGVLCPPVVPAVVLPEVLVLVLEPVVVDADTLLDVLEAKVVEDSPGPTAPPMVVMFTESPRKKIVLLFPQHAEVPLNSGAEQQYSPLPQLKTPLSTFFDSSAGTPDC